MTFGYVGLRVVFAFAFFAYAKNTTHNAEEEDEEHKTDTRDTCSSQLFVAGHDLM